MSYVAVKTIWEHTVYIYYWGAFAWIRYERGKNPI